MEDERLQIRKIVIDSRTATAGTGSAFEVQLPETITLPRHYGCYVTDIQRTQCMATRLWAPRTTTFIGLNA